MKKGMLRFSKRILILSLCTCLVSGSVIQRYKITAQATSIVIGGVSYTIGEVMAWLGATVLGITGTAYVASDDYSKLIEIGYEAAKAMDAELDNAQDWLFATMDKDGKAYFYANNYFDAIQSCDISSILETTGELSNDFAIFATDTLWDILIDYAFDIETSIAAGEENAISNVLPLYEPYFDPDVSAYDPVANTYRYSGSISYIDSSGNFKKFVIKNDKDYYGLQYAGYLDESKNVFFFKYYEKISTANLKFDEFTNNSLVSTGFKYYVKSDGSFLTISCNIPIFVNREACEAYLKDGVYGGCLNEREIFQITDWSESPQHGDVRDVITQNPALVNDYVAGMSNAFGTSLREQVVAGEYPDVIDTSIGATPFEKPDVITPSYVGELDVSWAPDLPAVDYPDVANPDLPWSNVWTDAGVGDTDIPSTDGSGTEDSDDTVTEEVIRGSDPFGINTLFGILVLLIMILLMLLIIFLSCLAFIIMIFRIEPTTGFLPPEMIQGFEYLKTLQIPGFGMSVYEFFMALIYIILIFTVIDILRKNIDKIKFPRKGARR